MRSSRRGILPVRRIGGEWIRYFGASLLAACLILATGAVASAEPVLVKAAPAPKATLSKSPTQVRLTFDEEVRATFSTIQVNSVRGVPASVSEVRAAPGTQNTLVADVKERLPNGSYAVLFRATPADGQPVQGSYNFSVRAAGASGETTAIGGSTRREGTGQRSTTDAAPGGTREAEPRTPQIVVGATVFVVLFGGILLLWVLESRRG